MFKNYFCNLQTLSENPPLLAPEGFFDEEELQLYPGKIIEYGDNLTPSAAFQQLQFNPQIFVQDITFLNDLMSEVSGIFPNMVGSIEEGATKTATEINAKTQGQITRLAMIVDIINQELIIPNVEKVAKLCADFKSGVETIFVSHDNKQEYIDVDDFVRQGDYKYTYSDNSTIALKSEQADLVVSAVERFAQVIPLNIEEIFLWYFEQKGVDNPERFLGVNNGVSGLNSGISNARMLQNQAVEPSTTQSVPTNEQVLLGMLGKMMDKIGNKKSNFMEILNGLKGKNVRKEK